MLNRAVMASISLPSKQVVKDELDAFQSAQSHQRVVVWWQPTDPSGAQPQQPASLIWWCWTRWQDIGARWRGRRVATSRWTHSAAHLLRHVAVMPAASQPWWRWHEEVTQQSVGDCWVDFTSCWTCSSQSISAQLADKTTRVAAEGVASTAAAAAAATANDDNFSWQVQLSAALSTRHSPYSALLKINAS